MSNSTPRQKKWFTVLALSAIFISVYNQWHWVWGILFIYWAYLGYKSGQTFLVEDIYKAQTPVLYWTLLGSWVVLGLYFLSALLA